MITPAQKKVNKMLSMLQTAIKLKASFYSKKSYKNKKTPVRVGSTNESDSYTVTVKK